MLMMSRVCAEFHDSKGVPIFTVTPTRRNTFVMAPEEIREDPLFQMLVNDGALTADVTPAERRNLENDPMAGVTAEGKKPKPKPLRTTSLRIRTRRPKTRTLRALTKLASPRRRSIMLANSPSRAATTP